MTKGRNDSWVLLARSSNYASNICFQAAACNVAVSVSTPSMSNRQAEMPLVSTGISALGSSETRCEDIATNPHLCGVLTQLLRDGKDRDDWAQDVLCPRVSVCRGLI